MLVELSTEEELESILNEDENQLNDERETEPNITDALINEGEKIESYTTILNADSQNEISDNLTGTSDNETENQGKILHIRQR